MCYILINLYKTECNFTLLTWDIISNWTPMLARYTSKRETEARMIKRK